MHDSVLAVVAVVDYNTVDFFMYTTRPPTQTPTRAPLLYMVKLLKSTPRQLFPLRRSQSNMANVSETVPRRSPPTTLRQYKCFLGVVSGNHHTHPGPILQVQNTRPLQYCFRQDPLKYRHNL